MAQTIDFDLSWSTDSRRQALVDLLKNNVCEVTFTKVDGSLRVMPCTLSSQHIPPRVNEGTAKTKAENPTTLSVWCTDMSAWRSFKIDNVSRIAALTPA